MISVVLVDDHKVFLQGMQSLLSSADGITVQNTFTSGKDLFHYLSNQEEYPDVIMLDIEMNGMNGVEVADNLSRMYPKIHIIMLSTYFDDKFVDKLVNTGVSGYLLKSTDFEELQKAIKNVADGKFSCSPEIMNILVDGYKASSKSEDSDEETGPLTEREVELLRLIADEFTTKEIAEKIFLSEHTVKTHRKNIMEKLDVKNTAGLIKKAYMLGLLQ